MNEQQVVEVVQIERDAIEIVHDAQSRADQRVAEAMQDADALRREVVREAQQQADKILEAGKAAAEAERAEIIGAAESNAEQMAARAASHRDAGIAFVVDFVTGRR